MSSRVQPSPAARSRAKRTQLHAVRGRKRLIKRSPARRIAPALAAGAIFVAATIFAVLLAQVVLAQTGFKMASLREEIVASEAEQAKLVLKAAKMSAKERIEKVAIERLGMIRPENVLYVVADVKKRPNRFLAEQQPEVIVPDAGAAAGGSAP